MDHTVNLVDGRREMFIRRPLPGGWVCAEPDLDHWSGMCGIPVESEPCEIHHPDATPGGIVSDAPDERWPSDVEIAARADAAALAEREVYGQP